MTWGQDYILHLFPPLPSLFISRGLRGSAGDFLLCVCVGFFPWAVYDLNGAFELHRTGSVIWYSTLWQIAKLGAAAELPALETMLRWLLRIK